MELVVCQNDHLMGQSFWKKNSFITHIIQLLNYAYFDIWPSPDNYDSPSKWLPKTGWASSNVAHRCRRAAARWCFYSAKNCPPATYTPVEYEKGIGKREQILKLNISQCLTKYDARGHYLNNFESQYHDQLWICFI